MAILKRGAETDHEDHGVENVPKKRHQENMGRAQSTGIRRPLKEMNQSDVTGADILLGVGRRGKACMINVLVNF